MNFNSFKVIIVALLTTSSALAQDGIFSKLQYGARLGATVSNFSNEQPHTSAKLGFMVGGIVEYSFSDKLSLQAEPSYLQQGGRFVRFSDDTRFGQFGGNNLYTTNSEVTVHTLDLPLLAKYQLPKFGDIQPNVVLGPAIGYTLGAENSYQTTYYNNQTFTTANAYRLEKSQYEPFQFGVTGGFGGEVSLGEGRLKRLMIDFRYRYGVTPVKKSYSYIDIFSVQGDLRTHSAYVTIGIGL
ncbi:MAG: porin family protein [Cyclobacteriaceae bacterium]